MWKDLRQVLYEVLNLRATTDTKGTIDSIRQATTLRGYNLWILACGAILASIGLDMSSVAVIIGAMLISPLMSPILGIGLAFGINDREHLIKAIESFAISALASLGVSVLYFLLTPFDGAPGPEITSRTMPTLLDVLIALFGGTAGIIANSRKDKTNAIPGVAIATALMPPICVAGYGLAKSEWSIFFGAFYLFFINAVFIALSTYLIVRYLKFPYAEYPNETSRRQAIGWIGVFALILIIPSIFFFINVIDKVQMENDVQAFISQEINSDTYKVSNSEIDRSDSIPRLILYIAGSPISNDSIEYFQKRKKAYNLEKLNIKFLQVSLSAEELADRSTQNVIKAINPKFSRLKLRMDSLELALKKTDEEKGPGFQQIKAEAKAIFPRLKKLTLASAAYSSELDSLQTDTLSLAITQWQPNTRRRDIDDQNKRLQSWLTLVLKADSVKVVSE